MDAALGPGQGIGRHIGSGESAERQIDAFIQKRHQSRVRDEGERASLEEAAWKESERRHIARRRARNRLAWIAYYEGQATRLEAALGSLVDHYRRKAEELREGAA